MNKEKEIKVLLSKDEYNRLDVLFCWSKDYYQINHYYGNESLFDSDLNTYRVREKNGKIKIQVKIPEKKEGSLHIKKEYEKEINSVPEIIKKEELTEITGIPFDEDKEYIGKLTTHRKECLDYENVEICLDKNEYLNKTDYEIEIEFKGEYPEEITSILERNGIKTSETVDGKNTRYMKEFLRMRTRQG
ncbi:MAG: CYTH domain-containing protein [Eubacterium sp.]|nr:CYTH domain-containing protein [Eubacterium sp.]